MMNDAKPVSIEAAALAALVLSSHLAKTLAHKGIMTEDEVQSMLRDIVAELGGTDSEMKARCRAAIQAVWPKMDLG